MGKTLGGVSGESVWLKSLAEHDIVDNFVQLTCSASDFYYTLSADSIHIVPYKFLGLLCFTEKRYTVTVYSFRVRWGMPDIVVTLFKKIP